MERREFALNTSKRGARTLDIGQERRQSGLRRLLDSPVANKLALLAAALTWGFSFFVAKDVTDAIPVFWLLAARFGIAPDRAVDYTADGQGTHVLYNTVSAAVGAVRANAPLNADWSDAIRKDNCRGQK